MGAYSDKGVFMTSFKINSIVQDNGSIVIPSSSLRPGTMVRVVVTAEPVSSVDSRTEAVGRAMREADQRYAETFRKLAE